MSGRSGRHRFRIEVASAPAPDETMLWFDDSFDSVPRQSFDDVVRLAAEFCGAAHAVICLQAGERPQAHASYSAAGTAGAPAPDLWADAVVPDELLIVPDLQDAPKQDGERFWANGELMPLRAGNGTVQGFLKIPRDRTQQRANESALPQAQDLLRLAIKATDIGIFTWIWSRASSPGTRGSVPCSACPRTRP